MRIFFKLPGTDEPAGFNIVGFLDQMLDDRDPRSAAEQFNEAYAHGGGWRAFDGFKMQPDHSIKYPGDPAFHVLAEATLREEKIYFLSTRLGCGGATGWEI